MIPAPSKSLTDLAMRILTHLVPEVGTTFAQADGALISSLLLTMAQDYERAVFNRIADIDEVKAICARCTADSMDLELPNAAAPAAFIGKAPISLRLTDVNVLHAEAFELLIAMHRWAEHHDQALNLEIWRLLRRHSERNKFDIPGP